jgi:hypothetical protein
MRRNGLLAAAAVIIFTNAVVLLEVSRNRAGRPVETIQLTERELPLGFQTNEDTGVSVHLNWRRLDYIGDDYSWLDRAKLQELGFKLSTAVPEPLHPPLPRPAFIALEYQGPVWDKLMKSAQSKPDAHPEILSRLIPVDAATTAEPLLRKYPNREGYLIVKGLVQLSAINRHGQLELRPFISEILPDSIHVSLPLSNPLRRFVGFFNPEHPRYTLTLSYGRSFEPWIVGVGEPGRN